MEGLLAVLNPFVDDNSIGAHSAHCIIDPATGLVPSTLFVPRSDLQRPSLDTSIASIQPESTPPHPTASVKSRSLASLTLGSVLFQPGALKASGSVIGIY